MQSTKQQKHSHNGDHKDEKMGHDHKEHAEGHHHGHHHHHNHHDGAKGHNHKHHHQNHHHSHHHHHGEEGHNPNHKHDHHHHHHHQHHDHNDHGHTHEKLDSPGSFSARDKPVKRDFLDRAFTVGIGGPVGSGKTALMYALCKALRRDYSVAAITNDIFTQEDGEFLLRHSALEPQRIRAIETGGCPHAAIREDISANLQAAEEMTGKHNADVVLVESGGDNLAANFSRELADYIIYVIDVAGGDKVPRKGGPGITQSDLLVINKTDLATAVGADLKRMREEAEVMRGGGPLVMAQVKFDVGVAEIKRHILEAREVAVGAPDAKKARVEADEA